MCLETLIVTTIVTFGNTMGLGGHIFLWYLF